MGDLEPSLTELRARLETVLRVSRAGTFHWHAPTGRFDCDASVARLHDLPDSRVAGIAQLAACLVAEDRAELLARWRDCVERAVAFELEVRVSRGDGSTRWLAVTARPFACAPSPSPPCVVGAYADTSALRRAAEAAALRTIANTIPQLVWIARADGRIEYGNDRWIDYTGRKLSRSDRWGLFRCFHDDDQPRVREAWRDATRRGDAIELEARIVCLRNEERWFLVRALPMTGPKGVIDRWVGTCTDIDDQKRAELALAAARDARDAAIATLGHELRHPLTSIGMAIDLAPDRGIDRTRATIGRQVTRMARLVDDMLDVTRATSGHLAIERRPVTIAPVIAESVDSCAAAASDRRQSLDVAVDPALVVDGDADRLVQVFSNLLKNAVEHTPPGGHVKIRGERSDREIVVEVRDDGEGIEPELLPRLFEPFVQGVPGSGRTAGVGLGLAIVRAIVERHGGHIDATSDGPGRGSQFTVRLPVSEEARIRGGPRRVLVIDDSADVTEMLGDMLRMDGHAVTIAHDGRSGLALAAADAFDVVLIDLQIPELDGRSVARALRRRHGASCPILVSISAAGHTGDPADADFDRALVKPFGAEAVRAVLS